MTLVEFLRARLDEDEATARAASPSPWHFGGVDSVAGGMLYDATRTIASVHYEQPEDHDGTIIRHLLVPEADANGAHIARHDPARVLAEVEAKRAIVHFYCDREATVELSNGAPAEQYALDSLERTLMLLAAVYVNHPDYDEAWRP